MHNALTIDVEENFDAAEVQASALPHCVSAESRVEGQTARVLDLLAMHGVRATFFVLGSVAVRRPALVRNILQAGHEVGCHSHAHRLVYELSAQEFRADTLRAVAAIADAGGVRPCIYRAPSYSITPASLWALDILVECGFTHDSSIYPIIHDRCGIPGFSRHARMVATGAGPIVEVPVASVDLGKGCVAPIGGGGYLRLLPYGYTAAGIRRVNLREKRPACIYFHPWELDPAQPQLARGAIARLRTYAGIAGMRAKLERLLTEFRFDTLTSVYPRGEIAAAA